MDEFLTRALGIGTSRDYFRGYVLCRCFHYEGFRTAPDKTVLSRISMFQFFAGVTIFVIATVCVISLGDDRRHHQTSFKRALANEVFPVERNIRFRKYAVACELATAFLKTYPYSPELHALRAVALAKLGETQKANEDCDRALFMKPGVSWIYLARGIVKVSEQAYADALTELEMAEQIGESANLAQLYSSKAQCEFKLAKYDQALSDCKRALEIDGSDPDALSVIKGLSQLQSKSSPGVHAK